MNYQIEAESRIASGVDELLASNKESIEAILKEMLASIEAGGYDPKLVQANAREIGFLAWDDMDFPPFEASVDA